MRPKPSPGASRHLGCQPPVTQGRRGVSQESERRICAEGSRYSDHEPQVADDYNAVAWRVNGLDGLVKSGVGGLEADSRVEESGQRPGSGGSTEAESPGQELAQGERADAVDDDRGLG